MEAAIDKSKLYDMAKSLTALLVVLAHATTMYTANGAIPVAGESAFLAAVTKYIYAFHMPLFIMLSGCVYGLCLERGKYQNTLAFLGSKAKKLLIPYLAFGVAYVAPVMCLLEVTQESFLQYVKNGILFSYNSRHLWYILALFWIFLFYQLLRPLIRKGWPGLAAVGFISLLVLLLSDRLPIRFQLRAAGSYQFFFFLGLLFNRLYSRIDRCFRRCQWAALLLPVLPLGIFFWNPNDLTAYLYKFIGIAMLMLLCWVLLRHFPALRQTRLYSAVARNSFGIYLFHPMIIYVLYHFLGQYHIPPVVLSSGIFLAATILSVYGTMALRKLRLGILIGE